MSIGRRAAAGILFISLLLSSCAPKRSEITLDTNRVPAQSLMNLVDSRNRGLTSISGSGLMSFDSPDVSGSLYFDLSLKKPDSLLVELEGPFGLDAAFFFLSRGKYVLYSALENKVMTGRPDSQVIRRALPFDLTVDQVFSLFSGGITFDGNTGTLERYAVEEEYFRLSFRAGTRRIDYWIDPDYLMVRKYRVADDTTGVLVDVRMDAIAEDNGVQAPKHIVVTFPAEQRMLSVRYSSIALNPSTTSFVYTVPSNARVTTPDVR